MKKLLILLLVIVMVCSFIACKKTGGNDVSSDNESTYSQVSVYEEDENYTSSELEEIVSNFKENVSIGIEFPDPSSEVSTTETPDATSSTTTTATSSDVTSGGTSTDTSTENTSSGPLWLGPF